MAESILQRAISNNSKTLAQTTVAGKGLIASAMRGESTPSPTIAAPLMRAEKGSNHENQS